MMIQTYRTREEWRALIAEFEQSGLSQKDFCEQRGLSPAYFGQRRLRLQREAEDNDTGFALAVPQPTTSQQSVQFTYRFKPSWCWGAVVGVTALGGATGQRAQRMKMFVEPPAIYLHKSAG